MPIMMSFTIRREIALRHPRIKYDSSRNVCEEYRWSQMPLKALFSDMRGYDPALKEKYRCKCPGHYRFTALALRNEYDMVATSGLYCWKHLLNQLHNMREYDSFVKWWNKQPEVVAFRYEHGEY